jgi:hypothetical protein
MLTNTFLIRYIIQSEWFKFGGHSCPFVVLNRSAIKEFGSSWQCGPALRVAFSWLLINCIINSLNCWVILLLERPFHRLKANEFDFLKSKTFLLSKSLKNCMVSRCDTILLLVGDQQILMNNFVSLELEDREWRG